MSLFQPVNLVKWIEEHKDQLKPPVGNKVVWRDERDTIIMIVGGPNARKDYHVNVTEEFFYQIKGGTVDYGKEHSARHGHARFGRTFPGLYPAWDAQHPVSPRPCLRVRAGGRARLERACQTCARPAKP